MNNTSLSGGHLLVRCLQSLGASRCFGVPGESYLDVLDALHDTQGKLDFVLCRNEGGASFMAEAYGKLTGNPGICMVTRGPGATNASIGVHTAMQNSSPMLLFVGQVGTDLRDREAFQEIDYRAFYGSVAKWVVEIDDADRIPELISRAWSTALSGRPGPVVVSLPENMLTTQTNAAPCQPVVIAEPAPPQSSIDAVVSVLEEAKKPLVLVGGGGWKDSARHDLQQFVERNKLPVSAAFRFQDLIDNKSECYIGDAGVGMSPALQGTIKAADVILAIGVRFGEMTTGAYSLLSVPHAGCRLIHVHPSADELGKIYSPELPINSGPNLTMQALSRLELDVAWDSWLTECRQQYLNGFDAPKQQGPVDMAAVTRWLRDQLPHDAIITNGAGNFASWPNKYIRYSGKQRLLAPQSGAMGYGLPAAIAAKVVRPEATVVCFCGDGDFQMNCQELGTAMQQQAQPIVLILNNSSYSTIRMHQERHYPNRVSGTDLSNPDFVALAKAYGFHAECVNSSDDFPAAYARSLQSSTGAVIELITSVEAITPGKTLDQVRKS
jgi:acetolactate synthase-1/2/3 large subunit